MSRPPQVGILSRWSPFSTGLRWEECSSLPVRIYDAQAVLLDDQLYIGGGNASTGPPFVWSCPVTAIMKSGWKAIQTPAVSDYALTSYRSQLMLVGGMDLDTDEETNKLWVYKSNQWKQPLSPSPMPTERSNASVASFFEYLIVAGGLKYSELPEYLVEIYNGECWGTACPLPFACSYMKSVVHDGMWYVMGGKEYLKNELYCTSLRSLIDTTRSDEFERADSVWVKLTGAPLLHSSPTVIGNTLVAIGGGNPRPSSAVYSYSPYSTETWKHVADMPIAVNSVCTIVLPSGELIAIGGLSEGGYSDQVFKVFQEKCVDSEKIADVLKEELTFLNQEVRPVKKLLLEGDKKRVLAEIERLKRTLSQDPEPVPMECIPFTEFEPRVPQLAAGGELRGVEVCADTKVFVTSSSQLFHWKDHGFTLRIPDGCLPPGVDQCTINISVSLAGQYKFPEGSQLVSAVYWLRCEPSCKFAKAISVEIQHCAPRENATKLSIIKGHCTQKLLPYTFKKVEGVFTEHSSYGYVELHSFSGVAVTQDKSKEREYCAGLYHLEKERLNPVFYFVVIWNTPSHVAEAEKHYKSKGAVQGPDLGFRFESEVISLDIPSDGVTVNGLWEIRPLTPLVIFKTQVDDFEPGRRIPSCQMQAYLSREEGKIPATEHGTIDTDKLPVLRHPVRIEGAKKPFNLITLSFIPSTNKKQGIAQHEPTLTPRLSELLQGLMPMAAEWENIGVCLEIADGDLKIVKKNERNARDCLREMLRLWLKSDSPHRTWEAVIEVIKTLGNQQLAEDLRLKYC